MAKLQSVSTQSEKRLPLRLRVGLESYDFTSADGQRHTGEKVKAVLLEPFPEYAEDFNEIRIAPRWKKDSAIFNFRMKHYFRTHDDVVLEGECVPVGFVSKLDVDGNPLPQGKEGQTVYYPGIFFSVPYRGEPVEFGFKKQQSTDANGKSILSDSADAYVFRDLVSEMWGGSFAPVESAALDEE